MGSSDPPAPASRVAVTGNIHHHAPLFFFFINFTVLVSLCHPDWSAVVPSWFTVTSASWFKRFSFLSLLSSWDYRRAPQAWLIFVFFVQMGFCYVGKAGLEFMASNDPPTSAS
ncbi:Protein GVQW1, partial [Plecturocebus cupreus]